MHLRIWNKACRLYSILNLLSTRNNSWRTDYISCCLRGELATLVTFCGEFGRAFYGSVFLFRWISCPHLLHCQAGASTIWQQPPMIIVPSSNCWTCSGSKQGIPYRIFPTGLWPQIGHFTGMRVRSILMMRNLPENRCEWRDFHGSAVSGRLKSPE